MTIEEKKAIRRQVFAAAFGATYARGGDAEQARARAEIAVEAFNSLDLTPDGRFALARLD